MLKIFVNFGGAALGVYKFLYTIIENIIIIMYFTFAGIALMIIIYEC